MALRADLRDVTLAVTAEPTATELAAIGDGLAAFNTEDVGPADRIPIAVVMRDGGKSIVAGLSGYTAWGWLYVQWLWVDERRRGRGLAREMLESAEAEAIIRGCHGSYNDTFNPTALKLYQEAGYTAFGKLEDFPEGRSRTFLQKPLGRR